ncbi:MAG: Glu/Leu/Phe/Val dehydrogenase family protein [Gemmatimonadales bacterium]
MTDGIESLIESWDGLGVLTRYDRPTETWIFIALHDDTLGQPCGGCRMKSYSDPRAALRDAMRLAEGMTYKWAGIGMLAGGGKSVLAVSRDLRGDERRGLFERFGELLDSLNGTYSTGMDLGTTPEDMLAIGSRSRWVHGVNSADGTTVDPGPFTALGVFESIVTTANRLGSGVDGLSVLVQGAGDVGRPLAGMLQQAGANVRVSDLNERRAREVGDELNVEVIQPHVVPAVSCDVFSPCAVGAVLSEQTIPQLKCRAVVGSANNQLETLDDADRLHDRGILWAPDYVANAGGAMAFGMIGAGESQDVAREKVKTLGSMLEQIYNEAAMRDESPVHSARRRVHRILEEARKKKAPK